MQHADVYVIPTPRTQLDRKYTERRQPLYTSRDTITRSIPSFWARILSNFGPIRGFLTGACVRQPRC